MKNYKIQTTEKGIITSLLLNISHIGNYKKVIVKEDKIE